MTFISILIHFNRNRVSGKRATMDILNNLKEISTRGRVAFAICCWESAMELLQTDKKKWQFVFDELWKFCSSNMAVWQERFGEVTPFSVCEKIDFNIKDYQYLTKEEHDALQELYDGADQVLLEIIMHIYEIGIRNMYVTINSEALKMASIPYLQSLIALMNENKFVLPDVNLFKKFSITDNNGWGFEFTRDDIFKKES
jgi:hypothetical protein